MDANEGVCRTCGIEAEDDSFVKLFETEATDKLVISEVLELFETLKLYVKQNDGLPQQICLDCLEISIGIYDFWDKCKKNLEKFILLNAKNEIKEEWIEGYENYALGEQSKEEDYDDILATSETSNIVAIDDIIFDNKQDPLKTDELEVIASEDINEKSNPNENVGDNLKGVWVVDYSLTAERLSKSAKASESQKPLTKRQKFGTECKFCHKFFIKIQKHLPVCAERSVAICRYCFLDIASEEEQMKHIEEKHPEKLNFCPVCSRKFPNQEACKRHADLKHSTGKHKCDVCSKEFPTVVHLDRHRSRIHCTKINRPCPICQKICATQAKYKYHMKYHEPNEKKRYHCRFCGKGFNLRQHKDNHESTHSDERPFQCEKCGDSFKNYNALKSHVVGKHNKKRIKTMPIKSNGQKFKCDICNAKLASRGTLYVHKKTHTKPYRCMHVDCGQRFATKASLKTHTTYSHFVNGNGENVFPFTCSICSKGFRGSEGLAHHLKMHTAYRPFKCDSCNDAFKSRTHLDSHRSRMHVNKKNIDCPHCDRKFHFGYDLKLHLVSHSDARPHSCPECPATFKRRQTAVIHLRTHTGEKPYKCLVCEMRFKTGVELRIHSTKHPESIKLVEERILNKLAETSIDYLGADADYVC